MFVVLFSTSAAHARGRGGIAHFRMVHTEKEVVFSVSPKHLRYAEKVFVKKHPGHNQCDDWSYDYDSQRYSTVCGNGTEKKYQDYKEIAVLMDGSIKATDRNDWSSKKIGYWDKKK